MDPIRVSDVLRVLFPYGLDFVEQEDLDRGTRCHFAMEVAVNNAITFGHPIGPPPWASVGLQEYPEEQHCITKLIEWIRTQDVEFLSAEEQESHKYGYTGRPDANVLWDGELAYWDWKFSESISEQNRMQLTAYSKFDGRRTSFIQCKKNGVVKAIKCRPDPHLWAYFLSGLNVVKFHRAQAPKEICHV